MKAMFDGGKQHDEWLAFGAVATLCRKGGVCIMVGIVLGVVGSHAQAPPITRSGGSGPLKGGGVRSRNMELVDIMPFKHNSEDQFELAVVDYPSGLATKRKHLLVTAHETQPGDPLHARYGGVKCLRIVDVTDPRNARQDYLRIYVRGKVSGDPVEQATSAFGNFGILQVYRDEQAPAVNTLNGDVFLLSWVGDKYGNNTGGLPIVVDGTSNSDPKARFLILDLSKAVQLCEAANSNSTGHVIDIPDAEYRNVRYGHNGNAPVLQNNANIYTGYIASDYDWFCKERLDPVEKSVQQDPHALNVDQESGILTLSPHALYSATKLGGADGKRAFFDAFDLKNLATKMGWTTNTTAAPSQLDRLWMRDASVSTTESHPLLYPEFVRNNQAFVPISRDIHIERVSASRVRISMAAPATHKRANSDRANKNRAGGVVTFAIDYSNPNDCDLVNTDWFDYDPDRGAPNKRFNTVTPAIDWWYRPCHSAAIFRHTNGVDNLIITTDELASPHHCPGQAGIVDPSAELKWGSDHAQFKLTINTSGSGPVDRWFSGGTFPALFNSENNANPTGIEDDRRIASYTSMWRTEANGDALRPRPVNAQPGDGPVLIYDAPESQGRDDLYYASIRTLPTTSVAIATKAVPLIDPTGTLPLGVAPKLSTDNKIAPSSTHRPHIIPPSDPRYASNNNDVMLSSYAQGVRMINLSDVGAATPVVLEKAFFDFIPTLTYDPFDPYFYKLAKRYDNQYGDWSRFGITTGNYFLGAIHSVMDFGPERATVDGQYQPTSSPAVRLPGDEKFVYVMGYGEGKLAQDVIGRKIDNDPASFDVLIAEQDDASVGSGRNWLDNGGFLVLRYYDGKLGGTISGYTGTNTFNDRSYRTLNLQGPFSVERDVTIAPGMCVFALPGHENDPGVFASTSFTRPGNQTIYVDGLLFLSVDGGDPNGTDILVDVPIVVRPGGKLIMNPIAPGKRIIINKPIVVHPDGEWTVNAGANIEFRAEQHTCNGRFAVAGTAAQRVLMTSKRLTSGPYQYGNQVWIKRTGGGGLDASTLSMAYCDARNLGLSFNDMYTSTNSTVSHCSFERTPGGAGLVSIAFLNVSDRTSLQRNHTLWVENSSFVDNAVTFPAFMITQGVNVSRAHSVYVKNSTFRNLTSGIVSVNLNRLHVEGSYIERCSLGVNSDALEYFMCRNAIENVKFSVNLYTVGQAEHNANGIGNTSFGIRSSAGGVNYYWNNTFDWYGRAIVAEGAGSHRLADFIVQYYIPGNAIPWTIPFVGGRNDFAPTPGRPTTWPAPIQFVDIDLITNGTGMPNLHVECGFNDFSLFSQYHAASNVPYPPLASSVNLWRGAPVQPRLNPNMTWTGVNLTVEEDPLAECYPQMEENASCGPVVVPGGWWSMGGGWTPSVPLVSNVISSNVGEMANPALSADARRLAAFSATAASSATESPLLHGMVRGALTSMSLNTSLPLHVRSTAAVLRAKTYVDRGDLDSAKLLFDGVVAGFPNGADSLNAAWSSMALTAVMAPANNRDSLMAGYVHRVIADLSDRSGAHMVFAKSMDEQPSQSAVAHDIVIGTVAPNPTSGDNLALTITSSHATVGTWELISVQGSIVARGPLRLAAGQSSYTVPIAGIANGMYALRLVADGHVVSTSVSIQR